MQAAFLTCTVSSSWCLYSFHLRLYLLFLCELFVEMVISAIIPKSFIPLDTVPELILNNKLRESGCKQ